MPKPAFSMTAGTTRKMRSMGGVGRGRGERKNVAKR